MHLNCLQTLCTIFLLGYSSHLILAVASSTSDQLVVVLRPFLSAISLASVLPKAVSVCILEDQVNGYLVIWSLFLHPLCPAYIPIKNQVSRVCPSLMMDNVRRNLLLSTWQQARIFSGSWHHALVGHHAHLILPYICISWLFLSCFSSAWPIGL